MKITATRQIPQNYVSFWRLNFNGKKATIIVNVAALFLLILFGTAFAVLIRLIRPGAVSLNFSISGSIGTTLIFLAEAVIITFVVMFVHEGFHGLFFWIFCGTKPIFGIKGYYAYAAAPGWYFRRGQYALIGLAPLLGITLLGILGALWLPKFFMMPIYLMLVFNASGAAGDIWVVLRLLFCPTDIWVLDQGDGVEFFTPANPGIKSE
jgi:hypothetical protein